MTTSVEALLDRYPSAPLFVDIPIWLPGAVTAWPPRRRRGTLTGKMLLFSASALFPPVSPAQQSQRKSKRPGVVCSSDPRSYWVRNACFDGFLTVHRRKALAQHEGLDEHSPEGEINGGVLFAVLRYMKTGLPRKQSWISPSQILAFFYVPWQLRTVRIYIF